MTFRFSPRRVGLPFVLTLNAFVLALFDPSWRQAPTLSVSRNLLLIWPSRKSGVVSRLSSTSFLTSFRPRRTPTALSPAHQHTPSPTLSLPTSPSSETSFKTQPTQPLRQISLRLRRGKERNERRRADLSSFSRGGRSLEKSFQLSQNWEEWYISFLHLQYHFRR